MTGLYPDLANKTILVTGASSGIGRAIAKAASQQNARVIITGRDQQRLNETLSALNANSFALTADLTLTEDRESLIEALPALDGICHCAGIISPMPVRYLNQEHFDKIFAINCTAPILLTASLLGKKKMNEHSSIVFISSIASDFVAKGNSLYSASKAALEAFSRSIVLEHYAKRIRSNCLKPALVKTPIYDNAKQLLTLGSTQNHEARYPLGIGEPEDVASAAMFLLSCASRWVASSSLVMDGGLTVGV